MENKQKKPIVLCIMDGWGINENIANNAVALAKTPNVDFLTKTFPYSTLDASGADVGLPIGQVGNSEVGHMNLGSGRVVLQTLPKINKAFDNNEIETTEPSFIPSTSPQPSISQKTSEPSTGPTVFVSLPTKNRLWINGVCVL